MYVKSALKKKDFGKNNLFIVNFIPKIIIHALKLILKNFDHFTSIPNAHGTL